MLICVSNTYLNTIAKGKYFKIYKTDNVRWGAFLQPLLQWKSNGYYIFWVCVCSLSYPACNAYAPYCHLWSVQLYNIFPHYLINGPIFEKKKSYWTQNVCFDFLYNFCLKTFLILRRTEREMIKNVCWSSCICSIPSFLCGTQGFHKNLPSHSIRGISFDLRPGLINSFGLLEHRSSPFVLWSSSASFTLGVPL